LSEVLRIDSNEMEAREVEGELVILDLKSQSYLAGNRTAAALWPLLREGATREQLASHLVSTFGVDDSTAQADVDSFVKSLSDLGLLDE
jgi:hypothetical protein